MLELVDGPTLADRLVHGPLPLDEAWPIARQVSEALEAAHAHGIIHRDLKRPTSKCALMVQRVDSDRPPVSTIRVIHSWFGSS